MALGKSKRLSKVVILITFIILSWLLFEVIIKGFGVVTKEYGIDPKAFLSVLIICEIFFNIGIVLMVLGSGVLKLKLKHILNLDFQNVVFENELVYTGFTINRIAAFVPPAYLLISGWGKLPGFIETLLIVELAIVLAIALIPFEISKLTEKKRGRIKIRNAQLSHLDQILAIDNERYGSISEEVTATAEMMRKRIQIGSDWFFVAEVNGAILGYISLQPTDKSISEFTSWEDSTDNGTLEKTFKPNGQYVYGVALTTSKRATGLNASDKLFAKAGKKVIFERKKMAYFSGRMPKYHKYKDKLCPQEYYDKRVEINGKLVALDPQIRMYESFGLKKVRLVKNGFKGDTESFGYSVVFKVDNPFYSLPFPRIWSSLFEAIAGSEFLLKIFLRGA